MSGHAARARHDTAPPCPVHPYGYHERPRVNAAGARTVLRSTSVVGIPARCARLEEELLDSDRELDFIDELWVRERSARGHGLAALGIALVVAWAVLLMVNDAASSVQTGAILAGGLLIVALDRGDGALQRERLRRIRDWHKRVGSPH
ncbi:hypothetical protein [Demequina sp.]|uniref:hypothetical protein n=1 Tax=Demequina sp. TaxID=2050685 RepID=UPI0025DEE3E0|nr:hypothetical protein [Demequina sp.]